MASIRPTVTVFAGSGTPNDPAIMNAARQLGATLGQAGYDIVYGGGDKGVMGETAQAAQEAGAHVTAIFPSIYAAEQQLPGAEVIHVATEQDRFQKLSTHNNPVAFFVLPGGPGALREAMQGLEKAVYEDGPPVILVQTGGYLDGIRHYFDHAVAAGFIKASKKDALKTWSATSDLSNVLPLRAASNGKKSPFIKP